MKLSNQFNHLPTLMDSLVNSFYDDAFLKKSFHNDVLSNVLETPEKFILELSLPGFSKENIHISMENNTLNIKGKREENAQSENIKHLRKEFTINTFQKKFNLEGLQTDNIEATYKNGILYVYLLKQKQETSSKEISIS